MKNFIVIFLITAVLVGCSSVKESTVTTVTSRDTTIAPRTIVDSIYVQDEDNAFKDWAQQTIGILQAENDSLRVHGSDTTKHVYNLSTIKPFEHEWSACKVTLSGDSVYVTFKYQKANGEFIFRVVPAKIKVQVTDTETTKVTEHQDPWYVKLWNDFKDFILVGLIIIFFFAFLMTRLKLLRLQ